MIALRNASAKDVWPIRRLIWRVGINPMGLDWRRFIVAVTEQDKIVGCGQVKPHSDGSRELASIAVTPESQGQGISRKIIERLLAEHPLPLYLTCRDQMERYYWKFGFQTIAPESMPPYFLRIWKAFIFLKRLAPGMARLLVMRKNGAASVDSTHGLV